MSSTPSRSSVLPPYAAPRAGASEREQSVGLAARTPFVPPTYAPRLDDNSVSSQEFEPPMPASGLHRAGDSGFDVAVGQFAPSPRVAADESLPWIEAFAADEATMQAEVEPARDELVEEELTQSPLLEPEAESTATSDTWAIEDATVSISHLAEDLTAASGITPPAPTIEAHSPWKDDEAWMDIMPALPNSGTNDPAADTSWARAFAEPPAPMLPPPLPKGDAQAAAASLEAVARRLRSGELRVPGFHAEAGDAAALAATLASLLGGHE